VGFSVGIYFLFNRSFFSLFIHISQFEVTGYFLSVFMPSFIILIVIGYLFVTTLGLKKAELSNVVPLCVLSLLCMVLSALSVFYFISFLGGFLALAALIKAYANPSFKTLSKSEAFFFMEIGAMLVVSFSALYLLMWLLSKFFQTYALGSYGSYSPYALLLVGVFSFLMFFAIPMIGSRGTNAAVCAASGFIMIIFSYLFAVQNRYVFFNAPAYVGIIMMVLGFVSALVGDLLYVKLFFTEPVGPVTPTTSLLHQGRYCPYCGKPRASSSQNSCFHCGRSLLWTPYAPFCSSCGRLVPTNAQSCPHCREDIENKRIYFDLKTTQEQVIASKLIEESWKEKSWITKELLKAKQRLQTVKKALWSVNRFFSVVIDRLSLTFKEAIFIIILTYLLGFISFVAYVRVEPSRLRTEEVVIFNYGFPLEWLQMISITSPFYVVDVAILWISLALDIMLYFLVSLALVYGVSRFTR